MSESVYVLDQEKITDFQNLVGDTNPIHYDPEIAKQSPFGGIVVPGFYLLSLEEAVGNVLGKRITFKFKNPAKPGDEVHLIDDGSNILYSVKGQTIIEGTISEAKELTDIKQVSGYEKWTNDEDVLRVSSYKHITNEDVLRVLNDVFRNSDSEVPLMYVASFVSPALIDGFGSDQGVYKKITLNFTKDQRLVTQ